MKPKSRIAALIAGCVVAALIVAMIVRGAREPRLHLGGGLRSKPAPLPDGWKSFPSTSRAVR